MKTWLRELPRSVGARGRGLARAVRQRPALAILTLLVAIPCACLFAVEVQSLRGSIYGIHEWRQGWTYSVAYLFVHESADFFHPRHAWRGHLTGIVGMEPPIYPYVLALLMRLFGEAPAVGRTLNFVLFLFGFGWLVKRLAQLHGYSTGLGYVVMASFSPLVLSEFRQIQPDPAMTSLSVMAAVVLHDHGRTGTRKSFMLGLSLYTLALLTKPIAIAVLPAMFLFTVMGEKRPRLSGMALRLLAFAIPLGLMFAWDRWANFLVARYMDGVALISIEHNLDTMIAEMKDVAARKLILLGLVQCWVTQVSLFPAVLLGIPYALQKETRSWAVPFLAWLAGAILISLAFSSRYWSNWYYMMLFAPPVLFFGAIALGRLFEVIGLQTRDPVSRVLAIGVVLAAVLVAPQLDELPWDHIENVGTQLAVHTRHAVVRGELYWAVLVCTIVASLSLLAFQQQVARVPVVLLAVMLTAASAWAMEKPYKDTRQSARFYTSELEWESGHIDSAEIRKAVRRYSRRDELFLMNGSNPALLTRALRVGYAEDAGTIDRLSRDFFVSKGVRFFMQFADSGGTPATMHGVPMLERGARWELYCIDPKGCPPRKH